MTFMQFNENYFAGYTVIGQDNQVYPYTNICFRSRAGNGGRCFLPSCRQFQF
jgi:hypothetical protein